MLFLFSLLLLDGFRFNITAESFRSAGSWKDFDVYLSAVFGKRFIIMIRSVNFDGILLSISKGR